MLTVSLHGIEVHAPIGLYAEEKVTGNAFETDVDIWLPDVQPWPFADYAVVHTVVIQVFSQPHELLETVVHDIHTALKAEFAEAEKIRVAVRKLKPPVAGAVRYSQVCYEQ